MIPFFDRFDESGNLSSDKVKKWVEWFVGNPIEISEVNLIEGTITLYNPSWWRTYSLKDHQLSNDSTHTSSVFNFPDDTRVFPFRTLTVYTRPGRMVEAEGFTGLQLLWHNTSGHLRMKPVLNTDGDTVVLSDNRLGLEIAGLTVQPRGESMAHLPGFGRSKSIFLRKANLFFAYLRLIILLIAGSFCGSSVITFVLLWLLSLLCDLLGRVVYSSLSGELKSEEFYVAIITLTDRIESILLYTTLAVLYKKKYYVRIGGMLILDFASFWMQAQSSRHDISQEYSSSDGICLLAKHYPFAVTAVGFGHLAFLVLMLTSHPSVLESVKILETVHSTSSCDLGICALSSTADNIYTALTACCVMKQILNLIQLLVSVAQLSERVVQDSAAALFDDKRRYMHQGSH